MRALALIAVVLLAGCSAPSNLPFARDSVSLEPYYKEYSEIMAGEHHKDFAIPVDHDAGTIALNVTLLSRGHGLPLPDAAPARLTLSLLAPDGSVLDSADLDPQTRNASLFAAGVAPGRYLARADGFGASSAVDGETYGAGYRLEVEIAYGT